MATAVLPPAEIAAPIRQLEAKQQNFTVLLAEVTAVNLADRTVDAAVPGVGVRKVAFDFLVVATGMRPSYFGHDEFAHCAPRLKTLNDAETIRAKILGAFEVAATTERARQMTFVLVGAGPTGVELAASLGQLVKVTDPERHGAVDPGAAASPIQKMLGTKTDRAGRPLVDPFPKVADAPGVFVVGDAASVMQYEHPVPGVAQAAIQERKYVGRLIERAEGAEGQTSVPLFRQGQHGRSLRTSGFPTWLVWAFVHILSLPQLRTVCVCSANGFGRISAASAVRA